MSTFILCEKCGKKLLSRSPNGIWQFKFGRREDSEPVVDMEIHGSIRMRCIKRSCRHINILNYFPDTHESAREGTRTILPNNPEQEKP